MSTFLLPHQASMSIAASIACAKKEGVDYLVTTKLTDGKTNFLGFLIIPFFEPVWTRVGYIYQLIEVDSGKVIAKKDVFHKETEWYFGKITIFDAVFDAGIFGKHWHSNAWGETVISDSLADTSLEISKELNDAGINNCQLEEEKRIVLAPVPQSVAIIEPPLEMTDQNEGTVEEIVPIQIGISMDARGVITPTYRQ